jgi:hypothetical protein
MQDERAHGGLGSLSDLAEVAGNRERDRRETDLENAGGSDGDGSLGMGHMGDTPPPGPRGIQVIEAELA